jgi:hypothetical protein
VVYATTFRLNLPRYYTPSPEISITLSEAVDFILIISVANVQLSGAVFRVRSNCLVGKTFFACYFRVIALSRKPAEIADAVRQDPTPVQSPSDNASTAARPLTAQTTMQAMTA